MKTSYRGYEIHVNRGTCLGGWTQLTYSIFREIDGREITSGFTDEEVTPRTYVGYMKERIDAEAASSDPWGAIKAAVDAEREACAGIAKEAMKGAVMSKYATMNECMSARDMAETIDKRIRARGGE